MRRHALTPSLFIVALLCAACTPHPDVIPTPVDDLDAAWQDFSLKLTGTLGDIAYWDLGPSALRELPVLHNDTWRGLVSAMDSNSGGGHGVMRCAEARLDGTIMTLTLRYGLIISRQLTEDEHECRSTATEFRVSLDLRDVDLTSLPPRRIGRGAGWLEFGMTREEIALAEHDFIAGHLARCRLTPGLLQYGKWGEFIEQTGEHRLRPCFIPGELRVPLEVLVERAKRAG